MQNIFIKLLYSLFGIHKVANKLTEEKRLTCLYINKTNTSIVLLKAPIINNLLQLIILLILKLHVNIDIDEL